MTARVAAQGDFALLEIEDSGIGISEDEAHKVFDRFYRVEGTGVEGSGLGLYVCRYIVEAHGGTIEAENNDGFCVTVRIPVTEKE